jgi:two-component sensor histidine kinase
MPHLDAYLILLLSRGARAFSFVQNTDLVYQRCVEPQRILSKFKDHPNAITLPDNSECVGLKDEDIFPGEVVDILKPVKYKALESKDPQNIEHTFFDKHKQPLHITMYVRSHFELDKDDPDKMNQFLIGFIRDDTDHSIKEVESAQTSRKLAESTKRFNLALRDSNITIFEQNLSLEYTYIANPPMQTEVSDYIGKNDLELFGKKGYQLRALKEQVLMSGQPYQGQVSVDYHGKERTFDLMLDPKKALHGGIIGVIGTAVDITQRIQRERDLNLALRELTHRTKNIMAVIQAMARQSAREEDNIETFLQYFQRRLSAIARSHDLLVGNNWGGTQLKSLVKEQISQAIDPEDQRLSFKGPDIMISPEATQNIGMALHELTTNAQKYGGLSKDDGRLCIEWVWKEDEAYPNGYLHFVWQEHNNHTIQEPERKGFGTFFLSKALALSLNGECDMSFQNNGLVFHMKILADHVVM